MTNWLRARADTNPSFFGQNSVVWKALAGSSVGLPEVYIGCDVWVCPLLADSSSTEFVTSGNYFMVFDLYGDGGQSYPQTNPEDFQNGDYEGPWINRPSSSAPQWRTEADGTLAIVPTAGLHHFDLHLKFATDTYTYKIDGVTDDLSGGGFLPGWMSQADVLAVGSYFFSSDAPNFVTNVTVGTTGYGTTDIFADDFSSGDISAWDGSEGDVQVVTAIGCNTATIVFDGQQAFQAA